MAEVQHSDRAHALLSASGATRWLNCTPSPRLEEQYVEPPTSSFAAEGTLAHEFGDIGLRLASGQIEQAEYHRLRAELITDEHYSSEMDTEVEKYIDFVMEQFMAAQKQTPGAILSVEEKIDLTHYIPDGFGTNDAIVIGDGVLHVDDLKYGKGLMVSAVDNPQLKLYGLGALRVHDLSYDIHTVSLNIIQPRLNHTSTWEIDAEELRQWGKDVIIPKAKKAFEGKGVQKAGDWCRWCKAKGTCATLAAQMVKIAKRDFVDKPTLQKDVRTLSDEQILDVFNQIPILNFWAEAVKKHVIDEAKAGKKWPGYKLVQGKSNRKWIDEEGVKKVLEAELFEPADYINTKLKGIGDIEKLVKKSNFNALLGKLVVKPLGAPTLVTDDDKRPAIGLQAAKADFK